MSIVLSHKNKKNKSVAGPRVKLTCEWVAQSIPDQWYSHVRGRGQDGLVLIECHGAIMHS